MTIWSSLHLVRFFFIFFFKRIWYIVTIFTEQILPLRRQNQLSLHEEVTVCRSDGMWHLQTARHAGSWALLTNPDDRLVSAHSTGSPGELPGPLQPCPGSNLAAESGSDPSKWPKYLEDMKNAEPSASDIIFFLSLFHYLILIISFHYYYYLFIIIILFYFNVWQAQALPCPCKASVTHRSTAWSLSTRRRLSLQLGARYKWDNQRSKSTLNPKLS